MRSWYFPTSWVLPYPNDLPWRSEINEFIDPWYDKVITHMVALCYLCMASSNRHNTTIMVLNMDTRYGQRKLLSICHLLRLGRSLLLFRHSHESLLRQSILTDSGPNSRLKHGWKWSQRQWHDSTTDHKHTRSANIAALPTPTATIVPH